MARTRSQPKESGVKESPTSEQMATVKRARQNKSTIAKEKQPLTKTKVKSSKAKQTEEQVGDEQQKEPKSLPKTETRRTKQPVAKKIKQSDSATPIEPSKTNHIEADSSSNTHESYPNNPQRDDEKKSDGEIIDFAKFKPTKVINESTSTKFITLVGNYNGDIAVIKIEKTRINEHDIKKILAESNTISERDFVNDIYSSYTLSSINSENSLNNLKAIVVWPATQSVLAKYTHDEYIIFSETPDHYLKVVEPYIANKLENETEYNQWVYNILEGKSEAERVIFNDADKDSGFMLVHDLNWSGDAKDLKLLAICHRRDIRSLRDLNDKHLILLKNILTKGTKATKDKYKKIGGQLRTYIHYHPSFYHFHVHFKVVDPSDYQSTDRDNLLSTVINNITLMSDYYKKSTLTYPLSHSNPVYLALKRAKRL